MSNSLVSEIGDKMMRWALPPLNTAIDGLIKQMDGLSRIWDDLKNGKKLAPAIWDESNRQLGKIPYSETFAKYKTKVPDLRPSFSKLGDEAFRVGTRKKPSEPHYSAATPVGVPGGMAPSATPAFARMQASPSINVSQIDVAKAKISDIQGSLASLNDPVSVKVDASSIDSVNGKAASAHSAVESLNMTATPFVNTGSIDSAIAKANQLHSALSSIGAAANAAAASVNNAAAAAGAATARIGSLRSRASSDYSTAGDPAK